MSAPAVPPAPTATVVVLGAGAGSRVGAGVNKVLLPLAGRPVLAWSLVAALSTPGVGRVVVVAAPGELDEVSEQLAAHLPTDDPAGGGPAVEVGLVEGGATRHASESRALRLLADDVAAGRTDVVVVHDGARPLASPALFAAVVAAAREHGGALPAATLTGVLTRALRPAPAGLVGVQTPQAFDAAALLECYRRADADRFEGTDTAACFSRYDDRPVVAVPSGAANLKVTWPEDLALAEELLARRP